MRLARRPVLARHVAVVSSRCSPRLTVALVVRPHTLKAAAASQLSLEVIDVRELDIWRCGLIVIPVLVEPGNGIRTRSTVRRLVVLRNRRRATLRQRLRLNWRCTQGGPYGGCDPESEPTSARESDRATVNLSHECLLFRHVDIWTDSLIPTDENPHYTHRPRSASRVTIKRRRALLAAQRDCTSQKQPLVAGAHSVTRRCPKQATHCGVF